nr:RNA-directed DNA polymerase, eukaryota [Tanacetum cinerariifolium]
MGYLHLSLSRAIEAGIFKGIKIGSALNISYLFYADDVIFIGEWSIANLSGITHILYCFSLLSGLTINLKKSHLLGVRISIESVNAATLNLGCSTMKTHFKYLGVMVGGKSLTSHAWNDTIGCNSSFIALIPKTHDPKFVNDYRPISLIGSLYKVVTKILASFLSPVISDLISDVQTAFLLNRQILDGPAHHDLLGSQKKLNMTLSMVNEQMTQLTSMCELACQIIQKNLEEKQLEEAQAVKAQSWKFPVCYDDDDDEEGYNFLNDNSISELPSYSAITPTEPVDPLIMEDEHLNTIPATESDEFIKSCVENLVPNPSESEGENGCDVPAGFTTFSNVLFDDDYDSDSSDDQSLSVEDVREKIYLNPLFDEEIIPMEIDQHSFNDESDLIGSMPNHDSSVTISSKIDSLFDMFTDRGVDLISHCHIRVGNGLCTQSWNEVWIGDTPLRVLFPCVYALEINKDCTVADKLQYSVTSSLRRTVRGGVEAF